MKYIPVFHPYGVALRSKSVPDGFVTKDFTMEWNNSVYSRLSKILCEFKDQVRARPSGEKCGLVIPFREESRLIRVSSPVTASYANTRLPRCFLSLEGTYRLI